MYKNIAALLSGFIFAIGLVVSGMTLPEKVLGFLNLAGLKKGISFTGEPGFWDPSLALVMGGALLVTVFAFWLTPKRGEPLFDSKFHLPQSQVIDKKLVFGSALFGIGWGLAGYCPGPAVASLLVGGGSVVVFVVAMLVGMVITKKLTPH